MLIQDDLTVIPVEEETTRRASLIVRIGEKRALLLAKNACIGKLQGTEDVRGIKRQRTK